MGIKLLWAGLTIMTALKHFMPGLEVAGAIIMGIGLALFLMDK